MKDPWPFDKLILEKQDLLKKAKRGAPEKIVLRREIRDLKLREAVALRKRATHIYELRNLSFEPF